MCGIIGIVTTRSRAEIASALPQGLSAMAHRGPDDEGLSFLTSESDAVTVAFGQRRLSILDLSAAGHQPMFDAASGDCITYNGEVFNFQEVRQSLIERGHQFQSNCDTEVLLRGLSAQGLAAIQAWRGMFALGFWRASERRLTLVRDRLGIKPLYYFHDGQTFIFASEIRALLATGLVPRRLSRAAAESYLAYGSVQQPLTILENVYALLPGHALHYANGQLWTESYWHLRANGASDHSSHASSEAETVAALREHLREAVRLRLVADVPVGVFLSGGIDSSAIVSLMRQATNGTIKSFSLTFKEDEFNEAEYATLVARQFGTEHQSVFTTEQEALARVPAALAALDQPSSDGLNSYLVSEAVAHAGLKVALSGAGGDEIFAGYNFFRTVAQSERLRKRALHMPLGLRQAAAAAVNVLPQNQRTSKLVALLRSEHLDDHSVYLHRRLFTDEHQRELLTLNGFAQSVRQREIERLNAWTTQLEQFSAGADAINHASALDLGGYLSNTLLRDTDAMSMAHSLEVRVPLLDHRLVEFMLGVPGNAKVRRGEPKHLLVKAVGNLPDDIVNRPKRGFELPFKHWLLGALRPQVEAEFDGCAARGIFQPTTLKRWWQDFQEGRVSWSRIWSLYVLSRWVTLNNITT